MVNEKLLGIATPKKLIEMGFVQKQDTTGDPIGTTWSIENDNFYLSIDAWCEVQLARKNPDTDFITLHIETLFDLECAVDWIAL